MLAGGSSRGSGQGNVGVGVGVGGRVSVGSGVCVGVGVSGSSRRTNGRTSRSPCVGVAEGEDVAEGPGVPNSDGVAVP